MQILLRVCFFASRVIFNYLSEKNILPRTSFETEKKNQNYWINY